jgi:endoglucanase
MSSQQRFLVIFWAFLGVWAAAAQTVTLPSGRDTPAYQTAIKLMRGVNFGNYLEYAVGQPAANQTYGASDFRLARSEGFDHIRVPVAWWIYCGPAPDYTISSTIFIKADAMVNGALNQGLAVIVDLHNFYDFYGNVAGNTNEFYAIWRQVAAHYASYPPTVVFELINEPNASGRNVATTPVLNGVYAETIRQIRLTNPNRTILCGASSFDSLSLQELNQFLLPSNDNNLMVVGHTYDPILFTHQGADWAGPDYATSGVLFPGPPPVPLQPAPSITTQWVTDWFRQYNAYPASSNPSSSVAFKSLIQQAKQWCDARHRPLIVDEFGCYDTADPVSRVNYYKSIRETMDALGVGWTMWDWKAGFHYEVNGSPDPPGIREAMFPPVKLLTSATGAIYFPAAIGKTFVMQQTASLLPPVAWQSVLTQTMVTPQFTFPVSATAAPTAYYRVEWVK